jgi:starvation-inducible DNA-binding protein
MTVLESPPPDDVRKTAGEALQGKVPDLIDLGLVGRQVHWTVVGRHFRTLHLQLDEVVATARTCQGTPAERAAAIGVLPDGRGENVHAESGVPQPRLEWIDARTTPSATSSASWRSSAPACGHGFWRPRMTRSRRTC